MAEKQGTQLVTATEQDPPAATFRAIPTVALVAVVFFALCMSPIMFQGGFWWLLLLIPLALGVAIVRVRTVVDVEGLHVREVVGRRSLPWTGVATLRLVDKGWVRAVASDEGGTELVLRGVRVRDLGRVGEASGGRITAPTPAEAQAALDHARELEAVRMRAAALRPEQDDDEAGAATTADTTAGAPPEATPGAAPAEGEAPGRP